RCGARARTAPRPRDARPEGARRDHDHRPDLVDRTRRAAVPPSGICLAQADGAGGREIGELLGQRLGFRYVDDGIVVAAAGAGQLYPEAVAFAESRDAGRKLEVDFHRFEPTERVRELIRDAI